jgi:hypothetical protein
MIRNTKLGGDDWQSGDALLSEDINDTIDELVRIVNNGY